MAASLNLPKHTLPSFLPTQTPRTPSSQSLAIPSKSSSQSQFYGLRFSFSSNLPIPSSTSFKTSISAKVSKGQAPPSFTLKDQDGRNVSLSKFKGKPVVVYFYPADETPGCTKQACAFRDSYEKFKKAGAEVIGISGDDSSSHKGGPCYVTDSVANGEHPRVAGERKSFWNLADARPVCTELLHTESAFAKKYRLPYTLLSDEGNKVRKEWGVPADFFGSLPGRQTYILDKNGVVQLIYNNQFQPEKHIDETLKFLQSS